MPLTQALPASSLANSRGDPIAPRGLHHEPDPGQRADLQITGATTVLGKLEFNCRRPEDSDPSPGGHQSSFWTGFRTYLRLTFLPLEQQDLSYLPSRGGVGVGGRQDLNDTWPLPFQLQNLDQILPTTPSVEQSKFSLVLKGKWPGSHQEETSPAEYNGWSFSCLVVTHCPHTAHTFLYANTPQLCPYAHCTRPHTPKHT